jgi:hypothetical protein
MFNNRLTSLLSKLWFLQFVLLVSATFPQSGPITGKPTNLDIHGNMDMSGMPMPGNVDRTSLSVTPATESTTITLKAKVAAAVPGTTGVSTRSYDNSRTGVNSNETTLTPDAVAQRGMRKLFSLKLADDARGVEAQSLIVPAVKIGDGTTHDVLIAATMADTIYAFDANDGTVLWVQRFGNPIQGTTKIDGWLINDNWGILSTPVVDPETKTLYFVTWSSADTTAGQGVHTFHSVSVANGIDVAQPIDLGQATYNPGNGLPIQKFSTLQRKQRSGLAFIKPAGRKTVIVPFGTISETSTNARGWVVAIDVETNKIAAAYTGTVRYSGAGVWMAGQAPATDNDGNLYVLTGNGSFDGKTEFSESFLKLKYTPSTGTTPGKIEPTDWWSPFTDSGRAGGPVDGDHITTNIGGGWDDSDLGSGGIALIPEYNILLGSGKDGILYTLRMNNLGKTQLSDFRTGAQFKNLLSPAVWFTYACFKHDKNGNVIGFEDSMPLNPLKLNFLYDNKTHHNHSTPVVFRQANNYLLYCWGENGNLRAWSIDKNGTLTYLANGPEVASSQVATGMPGGMLSLSSNGLNNGILWATVPYRDANKQVTQGVLYAYDASRFGKYADGSGSIRLLWTSPAFTYNKFDVPVVWNGKVYTPTYDGAIDVYGLK